MSSAKATGDRGEQLASEYLAANGFNILHRNWRAGRYEIDIVATRHGTLHIVEVKSRRRGSLTPPEAAMTPEKHARLLRAANAYIDAHGLDLETQIDLICIDLEHNGGGSVRYIPNAMQAAW